MGIQGLEVLSFDMECAGKEFQVQLDWSIGS